MNFKYLFKITIVLFFVGLQACTQIDNYMLGKDNTPKPKPLTSVDFKHKIRTHWSVPISKASKNSAYLKLKPVIRDNILYTADAAGKIQAFDKNSGHVVWMKQLKHGIISGPTIAEGYIAVATSASNVVVLKQKDGRKAWQAKISSDALAKPVIKNQHVIVKTIDGYLYAFNLKNGEKLWGADHGSPSIILKASSSPVVMDNLVLVGFSDGKLDAVDINTGRLMWQRSIAYARCKDT